MDDPKRIEAIGRLHRLREYFDSISREPNGIYDHEAAELDRDALDQAINDMMDISALARMTNGEVFEKVFGYSLCWEDGVTCPRMEGCGGNCDSCYFLHWENMKFRKIEDIKTGRYLKKGDKMLCDTE